jgi:hypothetical protein
MATDPRLSLVNLASALFNGNPSYSPVDSCTTVQQTAQQGVLGNLAALANITSAAVGAFQNINAGAGGPVAAGLSALVTVSNNVRLNGQSALPATSIGNGQGYVLTTVGIDPNQLQTASTVNPTIVAAAQTTASQVYNSVSQGAFTSTSITPAFSSLQNATQLLSTIFTPQPAPQNSQFGQACGASPYAMDLIALAPKYKFLFVVQFEFDPEFQSEVLSKNGGIDPAFVIKSSTRPAVDFNYEDINMYNFRTKVPTKVVYEPITMKFYDDDHNNAFQLYTTYLKLISPIANVDIATTSLDPLDAYDIAGGGMGFTNGNTKISAGWSQTVGQDYAASLGPYGYNPSTRNILRRITIFHVYRQGRMMNVMHFYNPKILKMELDELDMAVSEGTEVTLNFSYDSLYIIPGYRMLQDNTLNYNLYQQTDDGLYPLGVNPNTSINDGNPKDGFGVPYGQDTIANSSNILVTTPVSSGTTASGSSLTTIGNMAPSVGGGGTGTIPNNTGGPGTPQSVQTVSNSAVNPVGMQTTSPLTATTTPDPITGTTPTSADTSANLTNVQTAYSTQVAAINQNIDAQEAALRNAALPDLPDPAAIAGLEQQRRQQLWNAQNTSTTQTPVSNAVDDSGS